jgi:hypothetical protein
MRSRLAAQALAPLMPTILIKGGTRAFYKTCRKFFRAFVALFSFVRFKTCGAI